MNWLMSDVLTFARLSSAAYLANSKDATNASADGIKWIGQVGNPQCSATVARWGSLSIACFQGTRAGGAVGLSIPELWDDIDPSGTTLAGGLTVQSGFWDPMVALWPEIAKLMPSGQPVAIGHSLGGVRAQQAKGILRAAEVISFGAPRGADDAFWWWAYDATLPPLRVVHENDFAPDWKTPWAQPGPMLWLHGGGAVKAYARPGVETSILVPSDVEAHSIDEAYIPALEKIVAANPKAAARG